MLTIRIHRTASRRTSQTLRHLSLLSGVLSIVATSVYGAIPDHYEEAGIVPGRDYLNQIENEYINPFSGLLNLHYVDIVIPGNGGLDLKVERSYTSRGFTAASIFGFRGVNGVGWTLHFGRIAKPSDNVCSGDRTGNLLDNPLIEFPDGSRRILYHAQSVNPFGPLYLTADMWKADCAPNGDGLIVTSPEGVQYTMTHKRHAFAWSSNEYSWYATSIRDRNNNVININYRNDTLGYTFIDSVSTSDGRALVFAYADEGTYDVRLSSITARHGINSANWVTWQYGYTEIAGVNGDYWQLTQVTRPDGSKWLYEYNPRPVNANNEPGYHSLRLATHPYGGVVNYTYQYVEFDNNFFNPLNVAIRSKTIGGPSITPATWTFTFAPGAGVGSLDVTTVDAPDGRYVYRHFGLRAATSGSVWKVGLLIEKDVGGLQINRYEWTSLLISNEQQFRRTGDSTAVTDNQSSIPLLTKKTIIRDGTPYVTSYSDHDAFGNPRLVTETGNATRTTNITYLNNTSKWIIRQIKDETITGVGSILRTFDVNGNLQTRNEFGVTTTYTYHATGDIASIKNARGITTFFSGYKRGLAQAETHPEEVTIARAVNDTGTVQWLRNGRSHTTSFGYDKLNRLTAVTCPVNAPATITWSGATKTTRRSSYAEIVSFDGFGRPVRVTRRDAVTLNPDITITHSYDALGRKVFESYPNSTTGSTISYDALGRTKTVSHVDGTTRVFTYQSSNKVSVKNERNYVTTYTYRSYGDPNQKFLMVIAAPEAVTTTFTRDDLGNLTSVSQGGISRSYGYDARYFLVSEVNPETGTPTYGRDEVGNMTSRQVGSSLVTSYAYDGLNRLKTINYPGTTPDVSVTYDGNNNVLTASNGVSNRVYEYDANDNLRSETLTVNARTYGAAYGYNSLDYLQSITYPSGQIIAFNPDVLGRATIVSPYITTAIAYHPTGTPRDFLYVNGRRTDSFLNTRQWISRVRSYNNATFATNLEYLSYDGLGNVGRITDHVEPNFSRVMTYDGLDRLYNVNGAWGSGAIRYDTRGNITSQALGSFSLSYASLNNRLSSITGSKPYTFSYDVYGNVTGNGYHTFTYDDASNLRAINGGAVASYTYDANGMRVRVQQGGKDTYVFYAKNGDLLGEYDADGRFKEYFYLAGKLIAMRAVSPTNLAPVANAGANKEVGEGSPVALNGTGSSDPDGDPITYSWRQVSGPLVSLNNPTSPTPSFTAPQVAADSTLVFSLRVDDGDYGGRSSAQVSVIVRNTNPDDDNDGLADAWEMQHFGTLAFGPSDDPDGDGLTNLQEYLEGTNPSAANPPPNRVTVVSASGGLSSNTIAWQPVTAAARYNLYWSTSPGVTKLNGNKIAGVRTPYTHPNLTNGTAYYYVVTAENNSGESSESPEVSATPTIAPLIPILELLLGE